MNDVSEHVRSPPASLELSKEINLSNLGSQDLTRESREIDENYIVGMNINRSKGYNRVQF